MKFLINLIRLIMFILYVFHLFGLVFLWELVQVVCVEPIVLLSIVQVSFEIVARLLHQECAQALSRVAFLPRILDEDIHGIVVVLEVTLARKAKAINQIDQNKNIQNETKANKKYILCVELSPNLHCDRIAMILLKPSSHNSTLPELFSPRSSI